ncbi:hypothetical protein [Enterovibrio coralii]|uniref:Type IV pilus biogenesis protein PilP n=1 Tax=Enterovibrio coralii TaxID=294935 RepID=A0A135I5R6_9GAMM|nr:hypothetical protein [Enterovibrio coralii]KXF80795.1 hypothetical protein ATN88_16075 [Enterovibrio coralii]
MKNTIGYGSATLLLLSFSLQAQANEYNSYEKELKNIESLKVKLEQLELQKQIQQVRIELKEGGEKLKPTPKVTVPTVDQPKAHVQVEIKKEKRFNPELVELLYVFGNGEKVEAVLSYEGRTANVKNGDNYHGWRVNIKNRTVFLGNKGNTVEL